MKSHIIVFLFSLVFLHCSSDQTAGTASDVNSGTISGTLLYDGTNYNQSARVALVSNIEDPPANETASRVQDSSITDNGTFQFSDVPVGNYSIQVYQDEVRIGELDGIILEPGEERNVIINVNIVINQTFYVNTINNNTTINNFYLNNGIVESEDNGTYEFQFAGLETQEIQIEVVENGQIRFVDAQLVRNENGTYSIEIQDQNIDVQISGQSSSSSQLGVSSGSILSSADISNGSPDLVYSNDFESFSGLTLFGDPLPTLNANTPDGSLSAFDNNGDPNYSSGALVNGFYFDYSKGGKVSADTYVSSSDAGCWLSLSIGLAANAMKYSDTTNPGWQGFFFSSYYSGEACWADDQERRQLGWIRLRFQNNAGDWVNWEVSNEKQIYNDKWVNITVEILPDHTLKLFVDDVELFHSSETISLEYVNSSIWFGDRSSFYGDALIDNLQFWEYN